MFLQHAICSELHKVYCFWHCLWHFLFIYEISQELLNGFYHIHREDVFGPSIGQIWRSRSKVKVIRDKKRQISMEPLNRFMPDSRRIRVWSLSWTNLKVKGNFGGLHAVSCLEQHLCSGLCCICFLVTGDFYMLLWQHVHMYIICPAFM